RKIVTIEDNSIQGGFGSSVLELLATMGITTIQVTLLGHPDNFIEHGPQKTLWRDSGVDKESIIATCLEMTGSSTK
ncbi:MAG: 1-deoxy-D-xylulose-5-phosphate synthase, partial [Desulfobacterales bacterium]